MDERDTLLLALFELRITRADDADYAEKIEQLVVRLGGDPDARMFGADA